MIKGILVINNQGKVRLSKFYVRCEEETQQQVEREVYAVVSRRAERSCNFVELSSGGGGCAATAAAAAAFGADAKLVYRHYATLFFVFAVDASESELGILDLIQVFVEALDKCFENVCELDIIFHVDKIHYILDEIVQGGLVLETQIPAITSALAEQKRVSDRIDGTPGRSAQ